MVPSSQFPVLLLFIKVGFMFFMNQNPPPALARQEWVGSGPRHLPADPGTAASRRERLAHVCHWKIIDRSGALSQCANCSLGLCRCGSACIRWDDAETAVERAAGVFSVSPRSQLGWSAAFLNPGWSQQEYVHPLWEAWFSFFKSLSLLRHSVWRPCLVLKDKRFPHDHDNIEFFLALYYVLPK